MQTSAPAPLAHPAPRAQGRLTPYMLNHAAWSTPDAAATADFYVRIMGMDIASTVIGDKIPSTGDPIPYFHIFFRMLDGSTLAFFEAPGVPPPVQQTHPAYDIFNHIALQAAGREEVLAWMEWLRANGVDVIGPVDHDGLILSIYFHDPSGLRLEITTPIDPDWNRHTEKGSEDLAMWVGAKEKALAEGRDVPSAMIEMIVQARANRRQAHT